MGGSVLLAGNVRISINRSFGVGMATVWREYLPTCLMTFLATPRPPATTKPRRNLVQYTAEEPGLKKTRRTS
ncbi:hypothetical protein Pcinc_025915 [Petrolisthes cinctipes]|uniref:Uncharacterized protein n=1 Tax=Petrolisthes cinctipes TaxID=88211 RepID=A0AAE1KD37_PETCI|nr:hypothetical protein Pcinc_025915 [Petrolisthes cinctipes]